MVTGRVSRETLDRTALRRPMKYRTLCDGRALSRFSVPPPLWDSIILVQMFLNGSPPLRTLRPPQAASPHGYTTSCAERADWRS